MNFGAIVLESINEKQEYAKIFVIFAKKMLF